MKKQTVKPKENVVITANHEYTLSKEDVETLILTNKILVKTYITVKDKPVIIADGGEIFIKSADREIPKKKK